MSQPLLFVSPDDGQVYKVTGRELVSKEQIEAEIEHTQRHLDNLNIELQKFNDLSAPAATPAPADAPATPAPDNTATAPADASAAPSDASQAPVEQENPTAE